MRGRELGVTLAGEIVERDLEPVLHFSALTEFGQRIPGRRSQSHPETHLPQCTRLLRSRIQRCQAGNREG